jgi:hypothetical protein
MLRNSAENRLRVGISSLRRYGLRELIMTSPEGYLLVPSIGVAVED